MQKIEPKKDGAGLYVTKGCSFDGGAHSLAMWNWFYNNGNITNNLDGMLNFLL